MRPLRGKTALVVGGTAGIGLGVARNWAGAGARVVIAGRRADGADIASDIGCEFVAVDVSIEESVRNALAQARRIAGRVDVLALNAGIAQPVAPIERLDSALAIRVVEVNLLGVLWGLKHGPAQMSDGGSIIVTSSIAADLATGTEAVYGATKAGLSALARGAAIELGPRGIRVNAVQPGAIATAMDHLPDELVARLTPIGRKGRVDDLTGIYLLLASDASRYLTGQVIAVDGGLSAGIAAAALRGARLDGA